MGETGETGETGEMGEMGKTVETGRTAHWPPTHSLLFTFQDRIKGEAYHSFIFPCRPF